MSIPSGTPSPVPGSGPVPSQGTPPPQTAAPNKLELYKKISDTIDHLNLTEKTISGMTAKPLDKRAKIELVNKVVQLALDTGIAANEMESLIASGDLDLQTFIDNGALIDTYRNNVTQALQNLQNAGVMGVPGISRETILKLISAAFKADVMRAKGRVITTPEGDFLVRLKKGAGKVYVIPKASMARLGSGGFSVAYKINDLLASAPLVFKAVEPKNPSHFTRSLFEVKHEAKVLKEIHKGGIVPGVIPPPHAVIGIIVGNAGQAITSTQGVHRSGLLIPEYDQGNLANLIYGKWVDDWNNQIDTHMPERVEIGKRMIDGLIAIHNSGRNHGDIKLENMLAKMENNRVVADIADFGTSLSEAEITEKLKDPAFKRSPWGGNTSQYVCYDDCLEEIDAANAGDAADLHDIQKQRDVFALGMALCALLTSSPAFGQKTINGVDFADVSQNDYEQAIEDTFGQAVAPHLDPDLPDTLKSIFRKLLDPDLNNRYPADQVKAAFEWITTKYAFW